MILRFVSFVIIVLELFVISIAISLLLPKCLEGFGRLIGRCLLCDSMSSWVFRVLGCRLRIRIYNKP